MQLETVQLSEGTVKCKDSDNDNDSYFISFTGITVPVPAGLVVALLLLETPSSNPESKQNPPSSSPVIAQRLLAGNNENHVDCTLITSSSPARQL